MLPRGDRETTSVFQVPKPRGLALKSPNRGVFCINEGVTSGSTTGAGAGAGRFNFGLTGE